MSRLHLVPIPIAVTLIFLALLLIPVLPAAWVGVAITKVIQGVQRREPPWQILRTIGRWIGLSLILPWAAIFLLSLMILTQLALAPLNLLHHLRNLHETIHWLSTHLSPTPTTPSLPKLKPIPSTTPAYTFSPLPPNPSPTIRLLHLHPAPFSPDTPLLGTLTTTPLSSPAPYDALSYTWSNPDDNSPDDDGPPARDHTLYLSNDTGWTALQITEGCAMALRRMRSEQEVRVVWVDQVCVNQEDGGEKGLVVGWMDRVFCAARRVVVYTGEGDGEVEGVFEWVNGLSLEGWGDSGGGVGLKGGRGGWNLLGVGSPLEGVGKKGGGMLGKLVGMDGWVRSVDEALAALEGAWWDSRENGRQVWENVEEQCRALMPKMASCNPAVPDPPEDLPQVLRRYFSRRWFQRVWALQEVALPELSRIRFVCGNKTTTGERMMHLLTLLKDVEGINFGTILMSFQQPSWGSQSHLLDILVNTRNQHCQDPRDKIFGVLNIAKWLDHRDSASHPIPKIDYSQSVADIYASYSSQLIEWHGPGFFLALIKSSPSIPGLPSWAADWTVPWPDPRALAGLDSAAPSKAANDKDGVLGFETEEHSGRTVMKIMRPRIVRGFFTRDGQIDGTREIHIENVRQLNRDEVLVEVYPGLALLLRKEGGGTENHVFVRACPHSLSRQGVERIVVGWSRVVVNQEDLGRHDTHASPSRAYLSLPGVYKIV